MNPLNKTIIKSSKQFNLENEKYKIDATCPECNYYPNLSIYHFEGGFLSRDKEVKVNIYTCSKCGCEWEVREYKN